MFYCFQKYVLDNFFFVFVIIVIVTVLVIVIFTIFVLQCILKSKNIYLGGLILAAGNC